MVSQSLESGHRYSETSFPFSFRPCVMTHPDTGTYLHAGWVWRKIESFIDQCEYIVGYASLSDENYKGYFCPQ